MLTASSTAALAVSPGCALVNGGAFNYSGPPLTAGLVAITDTFYAGDAIRLSYTTNNAKPLVTLKLLHTTLELGLVITDNVTKSYVIDGVIGATGSALLTAGHVDALALTTPANRVTVTLTCAPAPAPTSVVVASAQNPTVYGQGATFSATVGSIGGTPTGNVVFTVDGTQQSPVALSGGVATWSSNTLPAKSHTVSAAYIGTSGFAGSSGTLAGGHRVNPATSAMTLASSPRPSVFGEPVTLTATVDPVSPGGLTVGGEVIFSIDGVDQPSVTLSGGRASFETRHMAAGARDITARYLGNTNYGASNATLPGRHTVNMAATSTALVLTPNPSTFRQGMTATATVTSLHAPVTGTVIFTVGGQAQAPVPLSGGVATFSSSALGVGSHAISAAYFGTSNFHASSDGPQAQVVNRALTETTMTGPGAITFGQPATFVAEVISGAGVPTGTVTFKVGNLSHPPVTLTGGRASITVAGLAGGSHAVEAHYDGTVSFDVSTGGLAGGQRVNAATSSTALTISPTPGSFGQTVTVWADVTSPAGVVDGSVIFTVDGFARPAVALSGGRASVVLNGLEARTHEISAAYGGTPSFGASASLAVNHVTAPATTTTTVVASPEPTVTGQGVTFTAHVGSGGGVPDGTVSFSIDNVVVASSVPLVGGMASYSRSDLGIGNHPVTVTYGGSANFAGSAGALPGGHTVTRASTSTQVSSSANPSTFGEGLSFTARVLATPPGVGTPGGTVTFSVGGIALLAQPLVGGVATVSAPLLAVGGHGVTAVYSGDALFGQSSGSLAGDQVVGLAGTTAGLTISPEPSHFGQPVTIKATITSGGGVPTGEVIFSIDGVAGAPTPLHAGTASLTRSDLAVGSRSIGVSYAGAGNFAASIDAVASHQVQLAGTTSTVTSSAPTAVWGNAVTLRARVTSDGGVPDGMVDFIVDGAVIAADVALVDGEASITTSSLVAGTRAISVAYAGTGQFASSIGTLVGGQKIDKATSSMVVSASANPAIYGQALTVSAVLGSGGAAPDGEVVFTLGSATHTVTLVGGRADLDLPGLEPGFYTISASYAGSDSFEPISGALAGGLNVTKAPSTVTVSGPPLPTPYGQAVTFTAAVVSSGLDPQGTVVFTVGGAVQPAVTVAGGVASITMPALGAGPHMVSADYSGNAHILSGSASLSSSHVVNAAPTTLVLSATPTIAEFGRPIELLAVVSASAGTPTGDVVFNIGGIDYAPVTLANNQARLVVSSLGIGPHPVTASYAAQNNHGASDHALTNGITVVARATSVSVEGPVGPVVVGQVATYTADVSNGSTPTGSVNFILDGNLAAPLTRPLIHGVARLDHAFATGGQHTIEVRYGGSLEFAPSHGALQGGQFVGPAETETTLSLSSNTVEFGDTVTATAHVSTGAGALSGLVEFSVDDVVVGSVLLNSGTASFDIKGFGVGPHRVEARFIGTLNHGQSHASTQTFSAALATSDAVLLVDPSEVFVGEPAQFTVTVQVPHGVAAGDVTFTVDGTGVATSALSPAGAATYQMRFATAGSHTIGASYAGTALFAPTVAANQTLIVKPAPLPVTLVSHVPEGVLNEDYVGSVTPVGGTGPYGVVRTSGALPPGLVIDDRTGAITGRPSAAGNYTFNVQATDADGAVVSRQYTITIIVPVVVSIDSVLPDGVAGLPYQSPMLAASGGAGGYTFTTEGTLPGTLAYVAATERIEGVSNQVGSFSFDVIATDSNGVKGRKTFTIKMVAPAIQAVMILPDGEVGVPYPGGRLTGDGGLGPYRYTVGSNPLPPGLVLDAVTGEVTGTPSAAGTYSVDFVIADANGFSTVETHVFSVTVVPVVSLPASLPGAREGRPYAQSVAASGAEAPYSYAVTRGSLPSGLTLDPSTGLISGTPTSPGLADFDITATDNWSPPRTGTQRYQVTTAAAVVMTMIAPPALEAGVPGYAHAFNAQGGSGNYSYALISGGLPAGIVFDEVRGRIEGSTTLVGGHGFVLEVTDTLTGDTFSSAFVLQVNAPVISVTQPTATGTFGVGYASGVTATGGQGLHTYSSSNLPLWLSLDTKTGALTGTPDATGTFTFDVVARDSNLFAGIAHVSINVGPPTTTLSALTVTSQFTARPFLDSVTATGGTSADAFSVVSGALPPGITLSPAGVLSGVPTLEGIYAFDIEVVDDNGFTGRRSYSITITSHLGTAELPLSLGHWIAGEPSSAPGAVTNDPGPFTYALANGSLPAGLSLHPDTGVISGTARVAADFVFDIVATKTATQQINTRSYVLSVVAPTHQAVGTLPGGTAGTLYPAQTVAANGGEGAYTYGAATGLPLGLAFDPLTATVSGTPREAGVFSIAIPVTDANRFTGVLTYPLTVAAPVITLAGGTLPGGMVAQAYGPSQFSAGGNGAPALSYTVSGGYLPPGLSLATDGTLSGTPTPPGQYSFEVTATDANRFTGTAQYELVVASNAGTVVFPPGLQDWTYGVPDTRSVAALSGDTAGTRYTVTAGRLPAGLDLDPMTGILSGEPTETGDFSFVVTASDGPLVNSNTFDLRILAPVLSLSVTLPATGRVGVAYLGDVDAATTGANLSFTYGIDNLPPGLTIDGSGTLSGTPTAAGTYAFTLTASDGDGFFVRSNHVLTIAPAFVTLALPADLPVAFEAVAYAALLEPSNGVAPFSYVVTGALPAGVSHDGSGGLSGTPGATGSFSITVDVTDADGNSGTQNYTLVVNAVVPPQPEATMMSLAMTPAAPAVGEPVTLSVEVRAAVGIPYGTVSSTDGFSRPLGTVTLDGSGKATLTYAFPEALAQTITASYAGNADFAANSAVSAPLTPTIATTSISLSGSTSVVEHGDPAVIVATVTRLAPAMGLPGQGTIRFLLGGVEIEAGSTSNGTLTLARPLPPGEHTLRVEYQPDAPASDMASAIDIAVVVEADTVVAVTGDAGSVESTMTTFTASVDTVPADPGHPTGTVEFMSGTTSLGIETLVDGEASLSIDTLSLGTHAIWVNYPGHGVFRARASSSVSHVVSAAAAPPLATTTALTLSHSAPAVSEVVNFDVEVSSGTSRVPTGLVDFIDTLDGLSIGSVWLDATGRGTLAYAFGDIGARQIEARYLGDTNFLGSVESKAISPVSAPTTVSLSPGNASTLVGDTLTLTATVSRTAPASGTPTSAMVEFLAGGTVIGSVSTNGSTSASFTTGALTADTVFSARYFGPFDRSDAASLSPSLNHPVVRAPVDMVITVTAVGSDYVIDVAIAPITPNGRTPTGLLVLSHAAGLFPDQTIDLASTAPRFTVPAAQFSPGMNVLAIAYGGDTYFAPDMGQVNHQVTGDTTISLAMSPTRPVPGRAVHFSATVLSTHGGVTPTGSVAFSFASATWSHSVSANLLAGIASTNITFPDATEGELTVIYSGDGIYQSNAASPLRRRIVMAEGLEATATALTSSNPAIGVGQGVTFTAQVGANNGTPGGSVVFYADEILLGSASLVGGIAQHTVPGFASGTYNIVAYYGGTALHGASVSPPISQRVLGADAVTFAITTRPQAFVELGQRVEVVYTLAATGGIDLSGISMAGSGGVVSCPQTTLGAGRSMECFSVYEISQADMLAGRVEFSGSVTLDGIGSIVSGASITLQAAAVAAQFETMTQGFISTRQKLVSSSLRLPDIFDRRNLAPGRRPGTVVARADGNSQLLGFASSLSDVRSWGAAEAAANLATAVALEPLPFDVWIDAQMTLHAQTGDAASWGDFSALSLGADYLIENVALFGLAVQGDWMHDFSDKGVVEGNGYLAGIYGSVALGENASIDGSLFYGQSWNTATARMFGETFSGQFETERILANLSLSGWWEIDALTIRPDIVMSLSSEDGEDYRVENAAGNAVLVEIERQTEFKIGVGSAFNYDIVFEESGTLTPKFNFELGLNGALGSKSMFESQFYGRTSVGLDFTTNNGVNLNGQIGADMDSGGFRAITARGGIGANF